MDENLDIKTFLEKLFSLTRFPMALFNFIDFNLESNFSSSTSLVKIYNHLINEEEIKNKLLNGSSFFLYNGIVSTFSIFKFNNYVLIVGPFINKSSSYYKNQELMKKYNINEKDINEIYEASNFNSSFSFLSFLSLLSLLEYFFNKKDIDILSYFKEEENKINPTLKKNFINEFLSTTNDETSVIHNTFNIEQRIKEYIKNGDIKGIEMYFSYLSKHQYFSEGKVANDPLRQEKNLFLGMIAYFAKTSAVEGGLSFEDACTFIDEYSRECEKLNSIEEVNNLRYASFIELTRLVANKKTNLKKYSLDVAKVLDYIKVNILKNPSIDDCLKYINKGRTSFLTTFKNEVGITLGKYITKTRLNETKNLLDYTNLSILDISLIYNFSSQSYFQNLFKKEFGLTPLSYRNRNK